MIFQICGLSYGCQVACLLPLMVCWCSDTPVCSLKCQWFTRRLTVSFLEGRGGLWPVALRQQVALMGWCRSGKLATDSWGFAPPLTAGLLLREITFLLPFYTQAPSLFGTSTASAGWTDIQCRCVPSFYRVYNQQAHSKDLITDLISASIKGLFRFSIALGRVRWVHTQTHMQL